MPEPSHPHCNNESSLGFRFRDILESAPIGIFTSTVEGRFLAVNPAFSRLFGYATPQECMETLSDVAAQQYYDPMDGDDFIRQLEDAGEVVNHECRMLRRDGTVIWVSRNVRYLWDENGKILGMQGFVTDITERKLHEHERREEEERFRLLFVNAPVPYQSLDEQGNFLDVNQAFLDVLGYSREDLIGKNFSTILHPDWVGHFQKNFPRFKAVGEILGVEFEMVKQDGTIILVSFNGRISRDTQGAFQRTHCIFQDITERSRIARELQKTLEHLREAERISGLGHWTFHLATGEMHASEQACRLFGIDPETPAKCTSTTLLQSIHPDDQEPVRRAWEMALANRSVFTIEHRIALAGGIRWIREYADLARTRDGNVLGTALDITDRKHAEKELLKFKAISDQAVHGIAITDLQGILLYTNAVSVKTPTPFPAR